MHYSLIAPKKLLSIKKKKNPHLLSLTFSSNINLHSVFKSLFHQPPVLCCFHHPQNHEHSQQHNETEKSVIPSMMQKSFARTNDISQYIHTQTKRDLNLFRTASREKETLPTFYIDTLHTHWGVWDVPYCKRVVWLS